MYCWTDAALEPPSLRRHACYDSLKHYLPSICRLPSLDSQTHTSTFSTSDWRANHHNERRVLFLVRQNKDKMFSLLPQFLGFFLMVRRLWQFKSKTELMQPWNVSLLHDWPEDNLNLHSFQWVNLYCNYLTKLFS